MFCALLTSRYQVSVYRTNGPLVKKHMTERLRLTETALCFSCNILRIQNSYVVGSYFEI